MARQNIDDPVRRRPAGKQQRGGTNRHRKGHRVAKPIGEEYLGRRIDEIILAHAQHTGTIGICRRAKAAMDMRHPLGLACRTR